MLSLKTIPKEQPGEEYKLLFMKQKINRRIRMVILITSGLIFSSIALAGENLLTLQRTLAMPKEIFPLRAAVAQYTITNHFGFKLDHITIQNLPKQVTMDSSLSTCHFPMSLANGASCQITLYYSGKVGEQFSDNEFEICPDASGQYCSQMSQNDTLTTSVVKSPQQIATLSTDTSSIIFTPENEVSINVTNSSKEPANNVILTLPDLSGDIPETGSILKCLNIPSNSSCDYKIITGATLASNSANNLLTLYGSNTNVLRITTGLSNSKIDMPSILFAEPGTKTIEITNLSSSSIDINSITVDTAKTPGVTVGAIPAACHGLLPKQSCTVTITATTAAYGKSLLSTQFTTNHTQKINTSEVAIASTQIAINPDINNQSQPVILNSTTKTGSFLLKNTGNFDWHKLSIDISASDKSWLSIDTSQCPDILAPQQTCAISYQLTAMSDSLATITVSGDNSAPSSTNLEIDHLISIGVNAEASNQQLDYRALNLNNLTTSNVTLTDLTIADSSQLKNKITLCNSTGSNCDPLHSSTCYNGAVLDSAGQCLLWIKANDQAELTNTISGSITIQATAISAAGTKTLISHKIMADYNNKLYIGLVGDQTNPKLMSFDGHSWEDLATSHSLHRSKTSKTLKGFIDLDMHSVYSLVRYQGNLLIGEKNLEVYNGESIKKISQLDNGATTQKLGILTMAPYKNALYIGGDFSKKDGDPLNAIGSWDGQTLHPFMDNGLNDTVYAFASLGDTLYIGGLFTAQPNQTSPLKQLIAFDDGHLTNLGEQLPQGWYVDHMQAYNHNLYFQASISAIISTLYKLEGTQHLISPLCDNGVNDWLDSTHYNNQLLMSIAGECIKNGERLEYLFYITPEGSLVSANDILNHPNRGELPYHKIYGHEGALYIWDNADKLYMFKDQNFVDYGQPPITQATIGSMLILPSIKLTNIEN